MDLGPSQQAISAKDLAQHLKIPDQSDWVFKILESLSANAPTSYIREESSHPLDDLFSSRN